MHITTVGLTKMSPHLHVTLHPNVDTPFKSTPNDDSCIHLPIFIFSFLLSQNETRTLWTQIVLFCIVNAIWTQSPA